MFFILAVCRVVGTLARRIGQPQVIGEMIAGVLMGPSLFGLLWPGAQKLIFPPESLKVLMAIVTTLMASPLFDGFMAATRARRARWVKFP